MTTTNGQLIDTHRQLRQAWRVIRFLSHGEDPHEVIQRMENLITATAFEIGKTEGLASIDDARRQAMEGLGMI